jgi:hypothetical protein
MFVAKALSAVYLRRRTYVMRNQSAAWFHKGKISPAGWDRYCLREPWHPHGREAEQVAPKIGKSWMTLCATFIRHWSQKQTRVEHELFEDPAWELKPMRI